jgi:hypothetical protein
MIDTVPHNVTLTEPIRSIPIKPMGPTLTMSANGTLTWKGSVRVCVYFCITCTSTEVYTQLWNFTSNPDRSITYGIYSPSYTLLTSYLRIDYLDRDGKSCSTCSLTSSVQRIPPIVDSGPDFVFPYGPIEVFLFNSTLNTTTAISSFTITLNEGKGRDSIHVNNEGFGFPQQSDIVLGDETCIVQPANETDVATLNVIAFVWLVSCYISHIGLISFQARGKQPAARVDLALGVLPENGHVPIPQIDIHPTPMQKGLQEPIYPEYTRFEASLKIPASSVAYSTYDIVLEYSGSDNIAVIDLLRVENTRTCVSYQN